MRILQSKFAEANPQTFKKGGGADIDPPLSCQVDKMPNYCRVTLRLRVTFLEIDDFDVVNATRLIVLFSLTYNSIFLKKIV